MRSALSTATSTSKVPESADVATRLPLPSRPTKAALAVETIANSAANISSGTRSNGFLAGTSDLSSPVERASSSSPLAPNAAAPASAAGPMIPRICGWMTSTTVITLSTETIAASAAAPDSGRGLPPAFAVLAKATVTAVDDTSAPARPLTSSPLAEPRTLTAI